MTAPHSPSFVKSSLTGLLAVAGALAVHLLLSGWLGGHVSLALFLLATLLAGLEGGALAAGLATALAALLIPILLGVERDLARNDLVDLVLFVAAGGGVALLLARVHRLKSREDDRRLLV